MPGNWQLTASHRLLFRQLTNAKTLREEQKFEHASEERCGSLMRRSLSAREPQGSIFAAGQICSARNRVAGLHLQHMSLHAVEVAGNGRFKNRHQSLGCLC